MNPMRRTLRNGYLAAAGGQNIIQMSLLQGIYFLEKHDKVSELVIFVQLFYTPERTKGRTR